MFLIDSPGQSSLDNSAGGQALTVKGRTLDSLFAELGLEKVGLLKIDIEGGEFAAFRNSRRLHDVRAIVGSFTMMGTPVDGTSVRNAQGLRHRSERISAIAASLWLSGKQIARALRESDQDHASS